MKLSVVSALRHRDFRLFYSGQLVSLIGTWMGRVAQAWLVLSLTDSAFYVGLVSALGMLPITLFSLQAGVLADRVSKHRLLWLTQVAAMVVAVVLALLVVTDLVQVWHVMVLAFLSGVTAAVEIPARHSLVVELVGKTDLMNAIALNSSAFNASRIIGPAVAGILIGTIGLSWCFFLNAGSYLAVLIALALIARPALRPEPETSFGRQLSEGLRYIRDDQRVSTLILMIAVISIFGFPFQVLLPVMAREVLGAGAEVYGWMVSAAGLGALIGALGLAVFARRIKRAVIVQRSFVAFGVSLALLASVRSVPVALIALILAGLTMIVTTATANTLLQTLSPDGLRGRVMSAYTFAFLGLGPLGAIQAGAVAERFGVPAAITVGSVACLLFAAVRLRRVSSLIPD